MLTLSRTLATQLLKLAQSSPQQQICGLLLGVDESGRAVVPLRNAAERPEVAHAFDEAEYARAIAQAQASQLRPLACYHSHPDSPPVPSAADLAARPDPALPLLVISLNTKGVLEMRAFIPDGESVRESPVQIFL